MTDYSNHNTVLAEKLRDEIAVLEAELKIFQAALGLVEGRDWGSEPQPESEPKSEAAPYKKRRKPRWTAEMRAQAAERAKAYWASVAAKKALKYAPKR